MTTDRPLARARRHRGPARRPLPAPSVALPSEHGGWGLTLEPALLGLVIAPSGPGFALAAAAFLAFLVRTPLKLALVDRRRHRRLERTALAERVAGVELVALAVLATLVVGSADRGWWVPVALAVPLVGIELWFDVRSRSRRLVPELTGAVGIGAVAAAIVLADGGPPALASAVWCVLAARALASIPFVRARIAALHGRMGGGRSPAPASWRRSSWRPSPCSSTGPSSAGPWPSSPSSRHRRSRPAGPHPAPPPWGSSRWSSAWSWSPRPRWGCWSS